MRFFFRLTGDTRMLLNGWRTQVSDFLIDSCHAENANAASFRISCQYKDLAGLAEQDGLIRHHREVRHGQCAETSWSHANVLEAGIHAG